MFLGPFEVERFFGFRDVYIWVLVQIIAKRSGPTPLGSQYEEIRLGQLFMHRLNDVSC